MKSTLPARPIRRPRRRGLLTLRITRGAWHAASVHQRAWACQQLTDLLADLRRGYPPRHAIARARGRH